MENNKTTERMDNKERTGLKAYEAPDTRKTQVELECDIMVGSKEKVVIDDDNTTVDIREHANGGSFELDKWDE